MPTLLPALLALALAAAPPPALHHFVFFNMDRERIAEPGFLALKGADGAQLKYTWKELEPEPGHYAFDDLEHDRAALAAHGKRLWVQLQDASFDPKRINVPGWLVADPRYHGGYAFQLDAGGKPAGTVALRWDPAVQARWQALLAALGARFDGKLAGLNLPETAIDMGEDAKKWPADFTPERYRDAVIANLQPLKRAFPHTTCVQYANFMPGEWRPDTDRGFLVSVYRAARAAGVGVGGPDLFPYKPSQMKNSYGLMKEASRDVPVVVAAQDGNYAWKLPTTHRTVTVGQMAEFAREQLGATTIFWCTEEPWFTRDVVPMLSR